MLSSTHLRRLLCEVRSLRSTPPDGIRIEVDEMDLTHVIGWIEGPSATPYVGGWFAVDMHFEGEGTSWPAGPPRCLMKTKIFHPNVSDSTHNICVNTLLKDWDPSYGPKHILEVVRCLLIEPNGDSVLNAEAGRCIHESWDEYLSNARLWTRVHASWRPNVFDDEAAQDEEMGAGKDGAKRKEARTSMGKPLGSSEAANACVVCVGGGEAAGIKAGTAASGQEAKVPASAPPMVKKAKTKGGMTSKAHKGLRRL